MTAIVVVSAAARFALALGVKAPWVFQDEIAYSDLARSLGTSGHYAIRQGAGLNGIGPVYPTLIAPAWALFGSVPDAYVAAKAINAVLMSLAAVPAFLIARRLATRTTAILAAVAAVAIPSMTYTSTLMTENAFYPAFLTVALLIMLVVESPTLWRQLGCLVAIGVAFLTRAQGVMLIPALVASILAASIVRGVDPGARRFRRVGSELRGYWLTGTILLIVLGGGAAYEAVRGRSLSALLGSYQGVTSLHYGYAATFRWFVFHLGELVLSVGVVPFIAFVVVALGGLRRPLEAPLTAFAATALSLTLFFALTAAAFAANPVGNRIEERDLFYVGPLLLIAMLTWIARGLPRPSMLFPIGVALAVGLPGAVPYDQLITSDAVHDAFGLVPLYSLELKGTITPVNVSAAVALAAIAGGLLAAVVRPRLAWVLAVVVLAYYGLAELRPIHNRVVAASHDALAAGMGGRRDWIDRRVGPDANVALLVYRGETALPYWENEFFNRSVRVLYTLSGPFDGLPRLDVLPDASGRLHDSGGGSVHSRYVLSNYQVEPAGRKLGEDPRTRMTLYETKGALRIRELNVGTYTDYWSASAVGYTQYGCDGGTLTATLLSDRDLHPRPETIVASSADRTLARFVYRPGLRPRTMRVPLVAVNGVCAVTFGVPTAVPQQVTGLPDTRALGVRFLRFDYSPRRAARSGARTASSSRARRSA